MNCRITDTKEVELLTRKFFHCRQRNPQLIFANHILARLSFNGDDLAFVARGDLLLQTLIQAFPSRVQSMDMILRRPPVSPITYRVAC